MYKAPTGKEGAAGDTIIAPGVKVEGDFQSQGNLIIEGEVLGSVKTAADLFVGEQARIHANVVASNAKVTGEIRGNIKIKERLELGPTSRISGDVRTKVLVVEPGASVNGKIQMGEEAAAEKSALAAEKTERVSEEKTTDGLTVLLGGRPAREREKEKTKV